MNGLTKVFVVLVTFLSVVLVALIVPFVANTENYKQSMADLATRLAMAQQTASLSTSNLEAANAKAASEISKIKNEVTQFTGQITNLTTDLAHAENEALTQRADNASLKSQITVLSATAKQYADITAALQKELSQRRAETLDLQTKLIELARSNNDLEEQRNTLNRSVRYGQEQMAALEEEVRKYDQLIQRLPAEQRSMLAPSQNASAVSAPDQPFVPSTQIRGAVTTVQKRLDDTYVQINIGTRDHVEPNMKFYVHRDGAFIGTLVIIKVDADAAAGRMSLVQGEVAQGDQVLTGGF